MKRGTICFAILSVLLFSGISHAQIPKLINFQGRLTDASGKPVANASYSVAFSLYDAATGGTALWSETQSVTTTDGLFSVLLGSVTAFPSTLAFDKTYYLGIKVGTNAEMTPRYQLASVAYALNADKLDGVDSTSVILDTNTKWKALTDQDGTLNNADTLHSHGLSVSGMVSVSPSQTQTIVSQNATTTPLSLKMATSQTAKPFSILDSAVITKFEIDTTGAITTGTIPYSSITRKAITDADISATAGILMSKLEGDPKTAGTINTASNPIDWTKLKGVPAGFADGTDDTGGGGTPASTVASLDGTSVVGISTNYGREDHKHSIGNNAITDAMLAGSISQSKISNLTTDLNNKVSLAPASNQTITAQNATTTPLLLKMAASPTASPFIVQNSASATIFSVDTSGAITTGTIPYSSVTSKSIVNADISATAAVADTKLATISTAGKVSDTALTGTNWTDLTDGGNTTLHTHTLSCTNCVLFGQASAQTDSSTNSGIFINKTSTGNLLQLQQGGLDKFVVSNAGNTTANTFISTVATGTAPLTVSSTTKVTNLNADTVDGVDSSDFVKMEQFTGQSTNAGGQVTVTLSSAPSMVSVFCNTNNRIAVNPTVVGSNVTVTILKTAYDKPSTTNATLGGLPGGVSAQSTLQTLSGTTDGGATQILVGNTNPSVAGSPGGHTHTFSGVNVPFQYTHSHGITSFTETNLPLAASEAGTITITVIYK